MLERDSAAWEAENYKLHSKLDAAEAKINELECVVQDLNEKYGYRG